MPSTILIKGHRFTGPSTGLVPSDGTLVVDPDTNELKVGDGSTPGGVALAGGGGGGGVSNIVEDTTPELGGDLVTGDNRITYAGSGTVSFLDFTVTQFGQNNNTVLSSVKSINMFLDSNGGDSGEAFRIYNNTNPDSSPTEDTYIFKVSENGDTNITGKLLLPDGSANANYAGFGANDDLKIFHNGNHSIVREVGTGDLYLQSDNNVILGSDSDTETYVKGIYNGAVELYHDNVKKFETLSDGVNVTGTLKVNGSAFSGGLSSRSTATGTTGSLADTAEADLDITGFKSYMLLTITTDRAARVRLYTTGAARTADASRAEGVDPTSDAGVIAEVITTGAQTVTISPGALGFNLEGTPTTNIPTRVTNKSGGTSTVQIDLNILQLEA